MTLDNNASGSYVRDYIEGALSRARMLGESQVDAVMDVLRRAGLDAAPDGIALAADDTDLGTCEWPTRSGWRTATCGRSGAKASEHWGIRLCWQHEDAVISEALARIRRGMAHDAVLDALVEVVRDGLLRPRHAGWTDAIDNEIIRRLEQGHFSNPRVEQAFKDHIAAAIKERWAA